MLAAYVAFVMALALSILAFRFVVARIPPILLAGCLAFMILRVSVGAITFLDHVDPSHDSM